MLLIVRCRGESPKKEDRPFYGTLQWEVERTAFSISHGFDKPEYKIPCAKAFKTGGAKFQRRFL